MPMNRRSFLRTSLAAGVSLAAIPPAEAQADRKYRLALVGTGWWGMNILRTAMDAGDCRLVALCDVDENQINRAAQEVQGKTSDSFKRRHDFREMLAHEKPEIVIVATPDHWHPLITIAAVNAGAHVYVEKPVSHTIAEGRAMVAAARKNDRRVQVGTHRRVSPHNISGMEFLKSGKVGRIGMVRAYLDGNGGAGGPTADSDPPPGLDWDFWLGPAPLRKYNRAIHPRGFRYFLDYANGQMGDWGVHWFDQLLWWTEQKAPRSISSTGGRFVRRDSTDAPDTQVATYEFEGFTAIWEHRDYGGSGSEKSWVGCTFYGTEGTFHMGWLDGWTFYPRNQGQASIHQPAQLHSPDSQNIQELWADFIASIRSGGRPICDIENGHRATTMSLLAMLSLKLGRSIPWDGEKEEIPGDAEANRLLRRQYRGPWVYPSA